MRHMLKVAMISPLPPQQTGESPYTARLIRELAAIGKVSIIAVAGKKANSLHSEKGIIETLPVWEGRDLKYPFSLLKLLTRIRPHLVHVHFGPHGEVYGGLFGEPMLILLLLLRLSGIKTTVTLHSTWMLDQVKQRVETYPKLGKLSFLARGIFKIYMRILDLATNFLQLSTVKSGSELRSRFLQEYKYSPEKVGEIPHPCIEPQTRLDLADALKKLGLQSKNVILLFGFIRRGKGYDIALTAMKNLRESTPNSVLLIAGSPQDSDGVAYLNELLELSHHFSLNDHVRFDIRFIPDEEIPVYFSAASAVLVPYMESVGASGPIHNFAGYGVPIVASDVGHHMKEALDESIILFKRGDSEDLADKLYRILSNRELAREIGNKQIRYVKKESWVLAAKRTIQYYKRIMAG